MARDILYLYSLYYYNKINNNNTIHTIINITHYYYLHFTKEKNFGTESLCACLRLHSFYMA